MSIFTKSILSAVLAVAFVGTAVSQEFSQDAKESYSLGASLGNYLSSQAYKQSELGVPVNMDQVMEGLTDALKNKSKLTEEEIIAALNTRAEKLNKLHEARVVTKNMSPIHKSSRVTLPARSGVLLDMRMICS